MSKDVASKKDDIQQLNRELEVTEQTCSSMQKSFQEFCPDIRHQETEVKRLRNRYSNINSQLQQRSERPSSLLYTVCLLFTWGKYSASDCELYPQTFYSKGQLCCKRPSIRTRNFTAPSNRSLLSSSICPTTRFSLVKVCRKSMPSKTLRWSVLNFTATRFKMVDLNISDNSGFWEFSVIPTQ